MARLNSLGSTTSCSALLLSITITDGVLSTLRRRISSAAPVSPAVLSLTRSARWTNSTRSPMAPSSKNANGARCRTSLSCGSDQVV